MPGHDELAGVALVDHADQRFEMRERAVAGLVYPLEMQLEQVLVDGVADALAPRQPCAHFAVGFLVGTEHAPGVLARALGLVHGDVGPCDQIVGVGRMGGIVGNAEAGGEPQVLAFEAEGNLGDGAHHALGQGFGFVVLHIGQEDGEFVAAQARQHLVAPHQRADLAGDANQQGVAGTVAVGVVDGLEFIEVEEHHRRAHLVAIGFEHGAPQFLLETVAVVEPGERIAFGEVDELFGGLALARHVLVDPQVADEAALAVAHGVVEFGDDAAIGHLDFEAVRDFARFQHRQQVLGEMVRPRQRGGGFGEHVLHAQPDQRHPFVDHPHAGEIRVVVDHAAVGADEQYAQVHGRQQGDETRAFLLGFVEVLALQGFRRAQFGQGFAQVGFGGLEVVDAEDAGADALVDAVVVVDRLPVHRAPEMRAVAAHQAQGIAFARCAAQRLAQLELGGGALVGVDHVDGKVHLAHAGADAVPQHPLDRGVDPEQPAFGRQPEFDVVRVVGDGMEPCLVFPCPLHVETHRLGHAVEGADELADFVFPSRLDQHFEVALCHALAGTGERFETADYAAGGKGQQQPGQDEGGDGDDEAVAHVLPGGLDDEGPGKHQGHFAIALARQFNRLDQFEIALAAGRPCLVYRPAGAVADFDVFQAAVLLQRFDDVAHTGVILLRQRGLQGHGQGAGDFLQALFGLLLEGVVAHPHAVPDQEREHDGLDRQRGQGQLVAQRKGAPPLFQGASRKRLWTSSAYGRKARSSWPSTDA